MILHSLIKLSRSARLRVALVGLFSLLVLMACAKSTSTTPSEPAPAPAPTPATTYTVTFNTGGGSAVAPQTITNGDKAKQPTPDPMWTGRIFNGWFTTAEAKVVFNFNTAITNDLTLYARWIVTYTVTFNTDGGTPVPSQTIGSNRMAMQPGNPSKSGDFFAGWFIKPGTKDKAFKFDFDTVKITSNTTVYAAWTDKGATVIFTNFNGLLVETQSIAFGEKATRPAKPVSNGYDFIDWYTAQTGGTLFSFSSPINVSNTIVYARWIKTFTVGFATNQGGTVALWTPQTQTVRQGSNAVRPTTAPTRVSHNFAGWFTSAATNTKFSFDSTGITADTTIYAGWELKSYPVTFITNTATPSAPAFTVQRVLHSSNAVEPAAPTWVGGTFRGWFTTAATNVPFNFASFAITSATNVYASWEQKRYAVTFITNVGNPAFTVQRVLHSSNAVAPSPAPTRTGFTFKGWFTTTATSVAFNFNNAITGPTTVYAAWMRNTYTVTFNSGGGSAVAAQRVLYTNRATLPSNPSRSGYTFRGWYTDAAFNNAFNFSTVITGNLTLYAKWSADIDFNTLSAAGNGNLKGIWSDGDTMWVSDDGDDDKIYAYRMSNKQRDPAKDFNTLFAARNNSLTSIWSDGTTMWVADYIDEKIYAYRMSDKARDGAKDFNTLKAAGNGNPRGLWSDGTTMWVADFADRKLYAYRLSDKARDSAKDFNTLFAAGNIQPAGLWSDGDTMWVADYEDDKIYAYRMSDKARDPAKDFNTLGAAGNGNPRDIWSDGTTMWVADDADNKIYAYSLSTKQRTPY